MTPLRRMSVVGLAAGAVLAAVLGPLGSASANDAPTPLVTDAVQVTDNPSPVRAHSSPQIAVNPTNGELVIVDSDIRGSRRCAISISSNAGRTWSSGGDPMLEPFTECSRIVINGPYATMAFDQTGTLYVAFRASDPKWANPHPPPSIPRHVFLARSADGGRTFDTTMVFEGPNEAAEAAGDLVQAGRNDRAMVAVDPSNPDHVYVGWQQGGSREEKGTSMVAASTDGGRTFGEPVDISDDRGGTQPRLAVDRQGTLHAVYGARTFGLPRPEAGQPSLPAPLVYRQSTDLGATWSDVAEIDPGVGNNRKWLISADPNSAALYVLWYGNTQTDDPGEADYLDVFLRASTDSGQTWGDPVVVNEGAANDSGVKRYDPNLSIAPNGRLDIAWYDFRNSPVPEGLGEYEFNDGGFQDVYYTWSDDGGQTFHHPDVRVTDRIIDRTIGVWSNNVHSHTNIGIASTNDAVYVAWQDTRNGNVDTDAEDIYMAAVGLDGTAPIVGATAAGGAPNWVPIAAGVAGLALGMGLAMMVAWRVTRRGGPSGGQGVPTT